MSKICSIDDEYWIIQFLQRPRFLLLITVEIAMKRTSKICRQCVYKQNEQCKRISSMPSIFTSSSFNFCWTLKIESVCEIFGFIYVR